MIWKCPNCYTEYEIDAKYADVLKAKKDCKFCVRKDSSIPTTAEMDGLLTQKDMRERFFVMKPCISCGKYTQQDVRKHNKPCAYCGGEMAIASTYWASLRTHTDKKKISAADRKKMGGA